eukprot:4647202-Pleurochrysis_carterae.AAC.1
MAPESLGGGPLACGAALHIIGFGEGATAAKPWPRLAIASLGSRNGGCDHCCGCVGAGCECD